MVSNKTLAFFIIVAVIVSLGGTLLSLNKVQELSRIPRVTIPKQVTGLVPSEVTLTITSNMSCNVDTNVSFGSAGQPASTITLSTDKDNTGNNFTNCLSGNACKGTQINNTGNVNIKVNFSSNVDGAGLLGGSHIAGDFNYTAINGTADAAPTESGCIGTGTNMGTWAAVPTTNTSICTNLSYTEHNAMESLEFNVSIDQNTPPGTKTATIAINCAQA